MTATYKPGDRVAIDWSQVQPTDNDKLYKYELERFVYGEVCTGTVEDVDSPHLIIIWDEQYHSAMYGSTGRQWNLHPKVLKYAKEETQEEKILQRIKKTYSKSKLSFVQQWSK